MKDVVSQDRQATLAAGFPSNWGSFSADYGFDVDVIGRFDTEGNSLGGDRFGGRYAETIQDDLKAIPTLSISMDIEDMFGRNGIYSNPVSEGTGWERATSVELINPDGTEGFQIDAGIRIQGGAFRRDDLSKKHSFRLLFKDEYGPTKLEFPFFGDDATDKFDTITLRMESNDGYAWAPAGTEAQYARDAFGSRLHAALGQISPHNNRVHLYINGIYWGMYNPVERPDASFSARYYGGEKDQWDAYNDGKTIDGSSDSWNEFVALAQRVASANSISSRRAAYEKIQGNNPDGTNNPSFEKYLDVNNYIDYLLTNFYVGNVDWPQRNWYASRLRGPESTGFKFHMWDAETALNLAGSGPSTNRTNADVEAAEPYSDLRRSEDFRLRFADRAHRALFNGGAFTPEESIARYEQILSEVDPAIVAESARWGDMHSSSPYHRTQWVTESNSVVRTFLTPRTTTFISQLRSAGLYPSTEAPVFSQHGGEVANGFELTMTASEEEIYFSTDGSDPRAADGSRAGTRFDAPVPISSSSTVKSRTHRNGQWSALNEATFWLPQVAGDVDGNGTIGFADFLILSANFGKSDAVFAEGDLDADGEVAFADFLILSSNIGKSNVQQSLSRG